MSAEIMKGKRLVWDKTSGAFVEPHLLRQRQVLTTVGSNKFLKGPVSLEWMKSAAQLGGKAFLVGMLIHYIAGLVSSTKGIAVTNQLVKPFGVSRRAKYLAVKRLADAGLITVKQECKASPRVTIVSKRGRPLARNQDSRARKWAGGS